MSDEKIQYKLLLPAELHRTLSAAAEENHRSLSSEIVLRLQTSLEAPEVIADRADLERMAANVKFDLATTRVENSIHVVRMAEMALMLKQVVLTLQVGEVVDSNKLIRWAESAEEFLQTSAKALTERPEVMAELDEASERIRKLSTRIGLLGDPKRERSTTEEKK